MAIVVFVVAVCALAALAVGGWLIVHLRAQVAAIDLRLYDLEQADARGPRDEDTEAAAHRSLMSGMPASSVLNDFALPNLAGSFTTLSQWRGQRIALIFVHPACPYSRALLPKIAAAASGDRDGITPVVISTGDVETNRALLGGKPVTFPVALQEEVELARLHRVVATPAAYLVGRDGVTEGPLLFGADSILVALAAGQISRADGAGTTPLTLTRRDRLQPLPVGRVVPDVELTALDGSRMYLGAALTRRTLVLLVEPDCPAAREIAPRLSVLTRSLPSDQDVVVVSTGDVDATRSFAAEFALACPIVSDPGRQTAAAVGAPNNPCAVLLAPGGRVAEPVAIGAAAVRQLLAGGAPNDAIRSRRVHADGRAAGFAHDVPLVSVILTTRDRPGFLQFALTCYERQTYPQRELIVVDDGDRFPVDPALVAAVGGRVVRAPVGTPIGSKLNLGLDVARGSLCQKMDDDDWYAPAYVETMVTKLRESWHDACRPTVAFVTPFLFFDVARWEIRRSLDRNVPGATLFFRRADWALHHFRPLPGDEDLWFFLDQVHAGAVPLVIEQPELFLAVRHRGSQRERGHTWINQQDNRPLEDFLLERPLHRRSPEKVLPPWAVAFYRELRADLLAAGSQSGQSAAKR
jgi:peroxiredoxin